VQEIYRRSIQGIFVQTKVTTEGLKDFEERVTTGSVVPLIDQPKPSGIRKLSGQTAIWKPRGQDRLHASGFLISCSKRAQESKGEIAWLK